MKLKIILIIICVILNSCVSKKKIQHPIVGKEVVIMRESLLYYVGEQVPFFQNYPYHLYGKDSGNSWRKQGWLKKGQRLQIHEVSRYRTDSMGEWIGVTGSLINNDKTHKNFIYCWSLSGDLLRAPWEPPSVRHRRTEKEWLGGFNPEVQR